jgi:membrane protease YdiL (CAAX protease family)
MIENYHQLLIEEIKNLSIFFIAMLITSGIAFLKGFYNLDKAEKIDIKVGYTLGVFSIYLIINFVFGFIFIFLFKGFMNKNNIVAYTVGINFVLNILVLFFLSLFCFKTNPALTKQIFKKRDIFPNSIAKDAFLGIICWFIAFPIVSFFASLLDIFILVLFKIPKLPDQIVIDFVKSTKSQPFYFAIAIFLIIIIAPILEEFLFRGVLHNFLKRFFKRNVAIIFSSIIFAFFHYAPSQRLSNIVLLSSLFILACFLSFLYEKQQSLISPIFLHMTFNAVSIINLVFIKGI